MDFDIALCHLKIWTNIVNYEISVLLVVWFFQVRMIELEVGIDTLLKFLCTLWKSWLLFANCHLQFIHTVYFQFGASIWFTLDWFSSREVENRPLVYSRFLNQIEHSSLLLSCRCILVHEVQVCNMYCSTLRSFYNPCVVGFWT